MLVAGVRLTLPGKSGGPALVPTATTGEAQKESNAMARPQTSRTEPTHAPSSHFASPALRSPTQAGLPNDLENL